MKRFKLTVHVFIKPAVLNPEEGPIKGALTALGFDTVLKIRKGKCFVITLEAIDPGEALALAAKMSEKLLINPVVEYFEFIDDLEEIP